MNDKQCRSRSVGFFRSQLIWIYTVCKGRVHTGSAGQGIDHIYPKNADMHLAIQLDPDQMPHSVASDQGVHCLSLIPPFLDISIKSKTDLFKFKDRIMSALPIVNVYNECSCTLSTDHVTEF